MSQAQPAQSYRPYLISLISLAMPTKIDLRLLNIVHFSFTRRNQSSNISSLNPRYTRISLSIISCQLKLASCLIMAQVSQLLKELHSSCTKNSYAAVLVLNLVHYYH
jgi:hypothetical protein